MRRIVKFSLLLPMALALVILAPSRADAITIQEIMDMTRAGISDDVLLALIEVDRSVFPVDTATLTKLKQAGVSETVMVAIVKSGRTPVPAPEAPPVDVAPQTPPEPQVVYVDREPTVIREIHEVVVPVPVYVAVGSVGSPRIRHHADVVSAVNTPDTLLRSLSNPFGTIGPQPEPQKRAEPVYWGWGGKRRPDSWDPAPDERTSRKR
jgi:hypothetical protein